MLTTLAIAAHAGPWGGGPGLLFFLIPLFWITLLVVIVAVAGRRWRRRAFEGGYHPGHYGPWGAAARNAESTLAERFAQGDIDEKEYRARLEVLRANNGPQRPNAS